MDLRRANVQCVYWDDATVNFASALSTTDTPTNAMSLVTLGKTDQSNV